jgi:hypothetical protein
MSPASATAFVRGYASPSSLLWPGVAFLICLAPIALWRKEAARAADPDHPTGTVADAGDITMEIPLPVSRQRSGDSVVADTAADPG